MTPPDPTPQPPPQLAPLTPLTPMLAQYMEIKSQVPDALLFFRMGDFYELFFEDAIKAAPLLEVQLTSRDRNASNPIPMCGVPHHALNIYLQKLVQKGQKVALCEQMEDPSQAKGIVRREITRIVTPALVGDPDLVSEDQDRTLLSIKDSLDTWEMVGFDLFSRRSFSFLAQNLEDALSFLQEVAPRELITTDTLSGSPWWPEFSKATQKILITIRPKYFHKSAQDAIDQYVKETQKTATTTTTPLAVPIISDYQMRIESSVLSSLEVLPHPGRNIESKTLFDVLNHTETSMGRRHLRYCLSHPWKNPTILQKRFQAVECLLNHPQKALEAKGILSQFRDLERLSSKAVLGLAQPRDLGLIRNVQSEIKSLQGCLLSLGSNLLDQLVLGLAPLEDLTRELIRSLVDGPPTHFRDGGIFQPDYHPELKELQDIALHSKERLAEMESIERATTGIGSLRIKFNKVFGYHIEVTKTNLSKVPNHYVRKQTIANGERYITEELKVFEDKILNSEQRLRRLEEALFLELRAKVVLNASSLLSNARLIGEIDCLLSLAQTAREHGYQKPKLTDGPLRIEEGRHPVLETLLPPGKYVPNSIVMDESSRTFLITGPNMAGKSTIMRQIALICLMAQVGSFVPAKLAELPVLDAIFTRIGSADDLTRGRSTFMVEMSETARILESASPQSLVIIDEIGRGTSTYDGLSLAWSLLEYLHKDVRAKTLFATHFHELTALEKYLPGLVNAHVSVRTWKNEMVFLYRFVPGVCLQSYGIEVGKLAGLPPRVLSRAHDLLRVLESQSQKATPRRSAALESHIEQLVFFSMESPPESLGTQGSEKKLN